MIAAEEKRLAALTAAQHVPALLVVDVQKSFAAPEFLGDYHLGVDNLAAVDQSIARMAALVDDARAAGVGVFWVELASDPARPWHSSQWLRTGDGETPYGPDEPCMIGTAGAEWFRLSPAEGEPRVLKRGYSGFLGTDLAEQLSAAGVTWVTVIGLTSECCVAATAEDAFQLDWPVVIPADATAAYDMRIHENALEQLALNVAAISTADEVAALWVQWNGGAR